MAGDGGRAAETLALMKPVKQTATKGV